MYTTAGGRSLMYYKCEINSHIYIQSPHISTCIKYIIDLGLLEV